MMQCLCGSYAINHHLHGRLAGKYEDMCDVCYWRISHKALQYLNAELLKALDLMVSTHEDGGWPTATITIARAAIDTAMERNP